MTSETVELMKMKLTVKPNLIEKYMDDILIVIKYIFLNNYTINLKLNFSIVNQNNSINYLVMVFTIIKKTLLSSCFSKLICNNEILNYFSNHESI